MSPFEFYRQIEEGYESGIADKFTFLLNKSEVVVQKTDEGGRPRKDDDQLTDAGLETREAGSNIVSGGKV